MKKSLFILIFIYILTIFSNNVYAYKNIPEKIKIGLNYGYNAASKVSISSDKGLKLGYEKDNEIIPFYSDLKLKEIIVIKDSYYIKSNNNIEESNGNEVSQGDIGPYHIQIGNDIDELEEAVEKVEEYLKDDLKAFLMYYKGIYKIWTGSFISEGSAEENIEYIRDLTNEECRIIQPGDKRFLIMSSDLSRIIFAYDGSDDNFIITSAEAESDSIVNINGSPYRGAVQLLRLSNSDMTVINYLDFEEYLYGVLPREMGGHWPLEALKAQAVAARTYAIKNMGRFKEYGFNLCPTTSCQVYSGYSVETARTTQAVNETKGQILTYNGDPAYTYYFSTSGGHTEDVRNVWGGSLPYLTGVEDPYENTQKADRGYWQVEMSSNDIKQKLIAQGINIGDITSVVPTKYSEAGRVIELTITGTRGEHKLTKNNTRNVFGASVIYSQCYTIESNNNFFVAGSSTDTAISSSINNMNVLTSNGIETIKNTSSVIYTRNSQEKKGCTSSSDKFIFNGKGYGHGVGLSQWGARGMAENGFSYDEIILHYFPGTILE